MLIHGQEYWFKLRPGLVDFLKDLSPYYELNVFSKASKDYAQAALKLIAIQMGSNEVGQCADVCISLLFDSMVLMMDDKVDVWLHSESLMNVWQTIYAFCHTCPIIHPNLATASHHHNATTGTQGASGHGDHDPYGAAPLDMGRGNPLYLWGHPAV